MTSRRTISGICLLCALIASALAAQAASAVSQTAVECTSTGTPLNSDRFADAHCKTKEAGKPNFHAATPFATKTATEGTNITTGVAWEPAVLKSFIMGTDITIEAQVVTFAKKFTLENNEAGGEMYAEGLSQELHIANVTTPIPNCGVAGMPPGGGADTPGTIQSWPIRATTKGQPEGVVKFEPQTGNQLAEFTFTGASCGLAGVPWPVYGSITSDKTEGATIPFSHSTVTGTKSLRLKNPTTGPVAGLTARVTIKKESDGTPIALT
jgi:hypothetical protein